MIKVYKEQIRHVTNILVENNRFDLIMDENELVVLDDIIGLLKPFYDATVTLSEQNNPTIALILTILDHLNTHLLNFHSSNAAEWLVTAVNSMCDKFQSYIALLYDFSVYAGTVLDPRFKRPDASSLLHRSEFEEQLKSLVSQKQQQENQQSRNVSQKVSFLQKLQLEKGMKCSDELERYLNEGPIDWCEDPILWWKTNESRFPSVASAAGDFLAIQPTSVPYE
ncbi:hypothetical protein P9112_010500 [Eukaryota sp. TZLM1-RC]